MCNSAPENYGSTTIYTSTTPEAVVSGGVTTCTIAQIVMEGPADKRGRSEEVEYESWKDFIGSLDRDYY